MAVVLHPTLLPTPFTSPGPLPPPHCRLTSSTRPHRASTALLLLHTLSTHLIHTSAPQVDVFNPATQRTYYFPCNQWLEKTGASDAGCRKELLVGGAEGDETRCKYKVWVKGGRGRWERQLLEPPYICAGCLTLMYCPALITYVLPYAG